MLSGNVGSPRPDAQSDLGTQRDGYAILGVSPFNSHFTETAITDLVAWASAGFAGFTLFIPDEPTVFSLMALGYSAKDARKKSRRQCSYLRNKCLKALHANGVPDDPARVTLHENLMGNERYRAKLCYVLEMYRSSTTFANACDAFGRDFLANKVALPDQQSVALASQYFLHELPVFIYGNHIFDVNRAVFVYPKCPTAVAAILDGNSPLLLTEKQPFLEFPLVETFDDIA